MTEFALLADVHLGRTKEIVNLWDYFLPYSDRGALGTALESRLRKAVARINLSPEIGFVVSVGDLTESLCQEQVESLRNILSRLEVTFLPIPGNHDIWPYKRDRDGRVLWNAREHINFSSFKKLFSQEFKSASGFFQKWKEQGERFANFSFSYDGVKFVAVDNVNRRQAPGGLPGAISRSKLYPESEHWLLEELRMAQEERIVIISHAPLKIPLPHDTKMGKKILTVNGHVHRYGLKNNGGIISLQANALYAEPVFPIINIGNFEIKKVDFGL